MSAPPPNRFSRRAWLRLASASILAPLFMRDARVARANALPKVRLILLMQPNGTSQQNFWPSPETGTSKILDPILSDPRLRAKTTIVKGLFNHAGGMGNQHDHGWAGMWTGRAPIGKFDDPWGAGKSIDHMIRERIALDVPYGNLNCGVLAIDTPPLKDHRTSFSYVGPRQPVPTETDPFRLYARLFAPLSDPEITKRRILEEKSVLDFATKDLARTRARLEGNERAKLDVHATALRDFEKRLSMLATQPRTCNAQAPILDPGIDVTSTDNIPVLLPAMLDLAALALACDLTRIVTFPLGNGGATWRYQWLGINKNSHEDIAHKDDGTKPDMTDYMTRIGRFQAEHVARLARTLDAIPEGDGTVLDNTLIVWANELATGQHGLDNIPVVLLGKAGGRLRAGGVIDSGPQPHHRLGCTVLNVMGVQADGFGEDPACGMLRGLDLRI